MQDRKRSACCLIVVINRLAVADAIPSARYGAPSFCQANGAGTRLNHRLAVTITFALLLSACFEQSKDSTPVDGDSASNGKPVISGVPPTSIRAGLAYAFTPTASDPDGDTLEFRISNKPAWAQFDAGTGRLSGTPQSADVGTVADIRISVTDGSHTAALSRFGITVSEVANGSATLSWYPPTQNADGSPLTDLAGYRVYYGRSADVLDQTINIGNEGLTALVVENLSAATWYFSMTSYNSQGVESARSPVVSKDVGG